MFSGSLVAIITPFNEDGSVDWAALEALVEWHVSAGTDGIVPCGTTGESATFTHAEQAETIARVVATAAGRVPVVAGAGANATSEAVSLAKAAEAAGADGVLTITPYYNKPNQEGLYRHFAAVREATGLPLVLYNVPGRTGVNLLPTTARRVADLGGVAAVKEASGDLGQAQELLELGVEVLSGNDELTYPLCCLGAKGAISVIANFAPQVVHDLCAAVAAGNLARGRELHAVACDLTRAAFCDTSPSPTKTALSLLGRCRERLRLPLVPLTDERRRQVRATLERHGLLRA